MTFQVFNSIHKFPGLQIKFHDFPGYVGTLYRLLSSSGWPLTLLDIMAGDKPNSILIGYRGTEWGAQFERSKNSITRMIAPPF